MKIFRNCNKFEYLQTRIFSTSPTKKADANVVVLIAAITTIPPGMRIFFSISTGLAFVLFSSWIYPMTEVINSINITDSQVEQASQFTTRISTYTGFINQQNIDLGVNVFRLYWEFIVNYISLLDINLDGWSPEALHTFLNQLWLLHIIHELLYENLQEFSGFLEATGLDLTNNTDLLSDFRNVGNTILRIVRRIEDILDIPIQDSNIIRHWYEFD